MFIAFEGIEGSGKSTAMGVVQKWLQDKGREVLLTREPGGTPLGLGLRGMLLDMRNVHIATETELFLYLADRAQHVRQIILPALNAGKTVLCDRYVDSTIAYQGYGRGFDIEKLLLLNSTAVGGLFPNITILFDLDVEVGLARARRRNEEENIAESEGRFEAEDLAFHSKIRKGYLELAAKYPDSYYVIDASLGPDEVAQQAIEAIAQNLYF